MSTYTRRTGPLTADDPRHGTNAGYLAHRRYDEPACKACLRGRGRARKGYTLAGLSGPTTYTPDQVAAVIEPWSAMGIGHTSILRAAGAGNGANGQLLAGRPVRRATYDALRAVTEASFPPATRVWAHLTRERVGSLMAGGHRLADLPLNPTGQWRTYEKVTIASAAAVRDFYGDHQHHDGGCDHTRTRALNAGRRPPAAWDDPGTLAWPLGATEPLNLEPAIDWVIVDRVIGGDGKVRTTRPEKVAVTAEWLNLGRPLASLERLTGWKSDRYTADARALLADRDDTRDGEAA